MATKSTVLYVDDSDDCVFLKTLPEDAGNSANFICANDGEEAVHYQKAVACGSLPSLPVLDLNRPRGNGRPTLSYLTPQLPFSSLPVDIPYTSENNKDKEACGGLGAVSYLKTSYWYDGYKGSVPNFFLHINA
jgi:hypothetical protein